MQKSSAKLTALIIALLGWFAIGAQLVLMLNNRQAPVVETLFRFFGFFTIDTNTIVAICFTSIFLAKGKFFFKASTLTAITVYITVVGIVYNIILRSLWEPTGMQKIVDELLHSLIPLLVILSWFTFVRSDQLKYKNAFAWLIYPIIYMSYALIQGAITDWYPYPFVDVTKLGYTKALINSCGVLLFIFVLSLVLIGIGKLIKRPQTGLEKVIT